MRLSETMSIKNQSARNLLFEGAAKLKTILISIPLISLVFLKDKKQIVASD